MSVWQFARPKVQAVVPAPDGCYPNYTTAEGCNALQFLGAGAGNTGVGWYSLFSVGDGNYNTGVGAGTLVLNTADSNTAVGAAAMLLNTTGSQNTAVGTDALLYNDTGGANTAVGDSALLFNTTGASNTATGLQALVHNTIGQRNTASGVDTLSSNTMGIGNTAAGYQALHRNTTGNGNTANGSEALFNNDTGSSNTAMGDRALPNNTTGSSNIALGVLAGVNVTTANDVICIGASLPGENVSNTCYIANIFGVTSAGATNVVVNPAGKLGTVVSSRRFKEKIKPMEQASEVLFALEPVTFRYKNDIDPAGTSQFGLVAEDVEKVNPDLVVRDKEGTPYSVRYDQVNAMLLNEFLKEHRKLEKLEATVAEQQKSFQSKLVEQEKRIEALASTFQKVSSTN